MRRNLMKREFAFERYYSLGADRSLTYLRLALEREGAPQAQRTLEQWSAQEHWQERIAAREREAVAAVQRLQVEDRVEALRRDHERARRIQELAFVRLEQCLEAEAVRPSDALRAYLAASELAGTTANALGSLQIAHARDALDEIRAQQALLAELDEAAEAPALDDGAPQTITIPLDWLRQAR